MPGSDGCMLRSGDAGVGGVVGREVTKSLMDAREEQRSSTRTRREEKRKDVRVFALSDGGGAWGTVLRTYLCGVRTCRFAVSRPFLARDERHQPR